MPHSSSDVKCFGIIPYRDGKYLLILREKGFWEFPKGHPEQNETPLESAHRELFEETGLTVTKILREKPYINRYGNKTVYLFLAEVKGEIKLQLEEVIDARWLSLDEVLNHLTYDNLKLIFRSL